MISTRGDVPPVLGARVVSLRLLPLALATIWAVTALPTDISRPGIDDRFWRTGLLDFFGNVLLYVPLGIALRRSAWAMVIAVAAAVSSAAEFSQLWYPERFAAATDVAANVGGALLGYAVSARGTRGTAWGLDPIVVTPPLAAASALLFAAAALVLSHPGRPADFSNWDPDCRVIAGDELTRDRRWEGEIRAAAVFDRSFGSGEIARISALEPEAAIAGLAASALFAFQPDAPLDSLRGVALMTASEQERFYSALVERGELCVVVWFRTASERQGGPARIFGFSKTPWAQNFSLGQEGRDLVFRLRTPTTLPGGFFPQTRAREVLAAGRPAVAAAAYDGRNVRLHVDGKLAARLNLAARGKTAPYLAEAGLPAAAFFLGALLAVPWVAAARRAGRSKLVFWGGLGGLAGGAIFVLAGGAAALPHFAAWVPVVSAWGGAVVGGSVPGGGEGRRDAGAFAPIRRKKG